MKLGATHVFWAVLSAVVFFAAVVTAVPEVKAITSTGGSAALTFLKAANEKPELAKAGSLTAQTAQMVECDDLLGSAFAISAGPAALRNVAEACLQRADRVLLSSPTFSAAHLVRSSALHQLAEPAKAVESLRRAQVLAPNEGWQAARRLRLAFAIAEGDSSTLPQTASLDASVVLQDHRYRALLAELYIRKPERRAWLSGAVEHGTARDRRDFLRLVKEISVDGGGA